MKTTPSAIALGAALAQPALAITFPSLTTIYVGSGVTDDGGGTNLGAATAFICSNVSGQSATLRFLVLNATGALVISNNTTIPHGGTKVTVTHVARGFAQDLNLGTWLPRSWGRQHRVD